jgi:flagellar assembly protein FliH
MSAILKKEDAEKLVFKHNPKLFRVEHSDVAKHFVKSQEEKKSGFKVAEVVAQLSGIQDMQQENIEKKVEGTVLERLKDIQENAYKQAYNLGLIEGAEKAFQERREDFLKRLETLDQTLGQIDNQKENLHRMTETMMVKLIYSVAEKIARRAISQDQMPIVDLLSSLVSELQAADSIFVKLSSSDYQFIEDLRQKKVKEVEKLSRVKLISQDDISQGGCLIETNYGEIDASVEQRIAKAWAALEAKLPRIQGENTP